MLFLASILALILRLRWLIICLVDFRTIIPQKSLCVVQFIFFDPVLISALGLLCILVDEITTDRSDEEWESEGLGDLRHGHVHGHFGAV